MAKRGPLRGSLKSIISKMLERGSTPSDIADSTGISYDQICKVQKQLLRVREE